MGFFDTTTKQETFNNAEDNRVAVGDGGKSLVAKGNSVINVTADEAFNLVAEVVEDYGEIVKSKDATAAGLAYEAMYLAETSTSSDLKEITEKALKFGLIALGIWAGLKVIK